MTGLEIVLISSLTLTSYRAVPEQTDDSPTITSIGHYVHPYGTAVSQDLLRSGEICYGDILLVPQYGFKVVNDTMHPRIKRGVDIFVETLAQEREVGVRRNQRMTLIKSPKRRCMKK